MYNLPQYNDDDDDDNDADNDGDGDDGDDDDGDNNDDDDDCKKVHNIIIFLFGFAILATTQEQLAYVYMIRHEWTD